MLEAVIFPLAFLGVLLAGIVNHVGWRRRVIRIRRHWMERLDKLRRDYEVLLSQQEQAFSGRTRNLVQKNLRLTAKLNELEAAYEELWKKVTQDA